ncbi:MAG: hypothetical protein ABL878_13455, partial [Burkholderiales bacterium]
MDKSKAVTAAAHKLARLIYTMLTKGEEYTDKGQDYYEERYRQRVVHQLSRRVEKLGLKLVPTEGRWGQRAVGRVEDRLTPALPHQTGHADFPHTA